MILSFPVFENDADLRPARLTIPKTIVRSQSSLQDLRLREERLNASDDVFRDYFKGSIHP